MNYRRGMEQVMGHPSPGQTEKPFTFISLKFSQILIRENFTNLIHHIFIMQKWLF